MLDATDRRRTQSPLGVLRAVGGPSMREKGDQPWLEGQASRHHEFGVHAGPVVAGEVADQFVSAGL